jgi:exopolyphosphatase/guanosine-5'-triphosphate,3'-diphosphate pyrophosphatase
VVADKRRASQIGAAIDVGSNSVHALVARLGRPAAVARRGLETLLDESQLLGLGDVVDELGLIPAAAQRDMLDALDGYVELARVAGARQVTLIGTEPFRRAANAAEVAAQVRRATGLPLHEVSVEVEAKLTFLGATGGRPPVEPIVVVDIGGGSTEIGFHVPGSPFAVTALAVGSARLTNAIVEHDPPTEDELERLRQAALEVRRELPARPAIRAGRPWLTALFVGGTATNLARLGRLTGAGLAEDWRMLARMTGTEITEHFGVRPRRARQLAAGAAIVEVLLDHFGLAEALVSNASLRDGAIIAAARFGGEWPERLDSFFATPAQPALEPASLSH